MSERPGFDSRSSQTKYFKMVVEAPLSNVRHIKGSSTRSEMSWPAIFHDYRECLLKHEITNLDLVRK